MIKLNRTGEINSDKNKIIKVIQGTVLVWYPDIILEGTTFLF